MDFGFTPEQEQLRDTVAKFLAREYEFTKQRHAIIGSSEGWSRAVWRQFAELGLLGIGIDEVHGGFGGDAVDTMIVMEQLGRALVVEPYFACAVLGAQAISLAGSESQKRGLLPKIAAGETLVATAFLEANARYDLHHVETLARREGDGYVINGKKSVVLHGDAADFLVISARTSGEARDENGITLFCIPRGGTGIATTAYRTLDNQRAADIELRDVRVSKDAVMHEPDRALPLIESVCERGIAALCAEALGAMSAMHEATMEYLRTRRQFGVPIGKFQALQHRAVDMLIDLEQTRSMAYFAAVKAQSVDAAERRRAISAAKNAIGRYGRHCAQEAVQLHGGMGVVDELNVSHYFRRLLAIDATLGDSDHHLERFAAAGVG
jgi:alkylation response protein AidB-like acyl-CoA dehydrogenase